MSTNRILQTRRDRRRENRFVRDHFERAEERKCRYWMRKHLRREARKQNQALALLIVVLCFSMLNNCAWEMAAPGYDPINGLGGSTDEPIINMPFPTGTRWMCTQGAYGSYSHNGNSTRYDCDFDTPNDPANYAQLYAPVSGVVYITYSATGFGNHLRIDRGDGTYVVLGHLDEFASNIDNGVWVNSGEFVGWAGCTGNCTGEHVHLGVHQGDATRNASQGTSIPFRVFAKDVDLGGGAEPWPTTDMVCDIPGGHRYESQLSVGSGSGNSGSGSGSGSDHDEEECDDDDTSGGASGSWDDDDDDDDAGSGSGSGSDDDDDASGDDDTGSGSGSGSGDGPVTTRTVEVWRDGFTGGWNLSVYDWDSHHGAWWGMTSPHYCSTGSASSHSCDIQMSSGDRFSINGEINSGGWLVTSAPSDSVASIQVDGLIYAMSSVRSTSPSGGPWSDVPSGTCRYGAAGNNDFWCTAH